MKRLILICGPNGVGKSTACRELVGKLGRTALVDSEYCRFMSPFSFEPPEVDVVVSNISTMMANYFGLLTIENVVFPYGFHGPRRLIFERVLEQLDARQISYRLCPIVLTCALEENVSRMRTDGRDEERIRRATANTRAIYERVGYPSIDTTGLSVSRTVDRIVELLSIKYPGP